MTNIITSRKSGWRERPGSKYKGAHESEVRQRAREVLDNGGSIKDAQNAVRELTMHDSPKKCWDNFQAGVDEIGKASKPKYNVVVENDSVVDVPIE